MKRGQNIVLLIIAILLHGPASEGSANNRIMPTDFAYKGAFRLPDVSGECNWTYSGHGMTYFPDGNPTNTDGYPGSLFSSGNDANCQHISEISIPGPVISRQKKISELPTAVTLQPFADIRNNSFGSHEGLIIPRVGLEYLPPQGSQATGKLHFCWGQHIQDFEASHGWCDLGLSAPQTKGPWHFGPWTNYVTNDYMFEIPASWAASATPGHLLASGRAREGPWAGLGPALFSYAPWQDGTPPPPNSTLTHITPLLLYGEQQPGTPEILTNPTRQVAQYNDADHWWSGAWLTADDKSAVIFIGTKALGNTWYGFADGTVWPYECNQDGAPACPEVPGFPYNDRGFWADGYSAQIMFYDPNDLADVVSGKKKSWEPQPYAFYSIDHYLFDPFTATKKESFLIRYKRDLVVAAAYDRARNLIYITERQADEEKGIIHVWQINSNSPINRNTGPTTSPMMLLLNAEPE